MVYEITLPKLKYFTVVVKNMFLVLGDTHQSIYRLMVMMSKIYSERFRTICK